MFLFHITKFPEWFYWLRKDFLHPTKCYQSFTHPFKSIWQNTTVWHNIAGQKKNKKKQNKTKNNVEIMQKD